MLAFGIVSILLLLTAGIVLCTLLDFEEEELGPVLVFLSIIVIFVVPPIVYIAISLAGS